MRTLVLDRKNIVADGNNNTLIYKFPNSVKFQNSYVSISSLTMFYSWFNISALLGNNTFAYSWQGSPLTTVTIPDGLYEISQINDILKLHFLSTNRYIIDSVTGEYVFYLSLFINPSRYAVQVKTTQVPTALPAGFSAPPGGFNTTGFPATVFAPTLVVSTAFGSIIGFQASTIGDGLTTNNYFSTKSPNIQPNSTVLVSCSGVDNSIASPSNIIYSVSPSVSVGEKIAVKPPTFLWCRLISGTYNQLEIKLLGTDLSQLKINNPEICIILAMAEGNEI
jgi:hypothetical protein